MFAFCQERHFILQLQGPTYMQGLKEHVAGFSNDSFVFTERHAFDDILLYLNIFVILVISLAEICKGSKIGVSDSTVLLVPCFQTLQLGRCLLFVCP